MEKLEFIPTEQCIKNILHLRKWKYVSFSDMNDHGEWRQYTSDWPGSQRDTVIRSQSDCPLLPTLEYCKLPHGYTWTKGPTPNGRLWRAWKDNKVIASTIETEDELNDRFNLLLKLEMAIIDGNTLIKNPYFKYEINNPCMEIPLNQVYVTSPINVTTIKPDACVSTLTDITEGIEPTISKIPHFRVNKPGFFIDEIKIGSEECM